MTLTIRPMVERDLSSVNLIQTDAYAGYFLESAEVIAQRYYLSPGTAWVAEYNGTVCAYLVAYWSLVGKINPLNAHFFPIENANCLYLHDLALAKTAQGLGIAKKLITTAVSCAEENAARAMALLSVQNSKQFWLNAGFTEFFDLDDIQRANLESYLDEDVLDGENKHAAFYMVKFLNNL